jgi:acyl-CoA dehydrogenase
MVKTDPDAARHQQHSQILVPMTTPGVEVVRPIDVFGHDMAPHGHMHLKLNDVYIPEDHIIAGRGRGFAKINGNYSGARDTHSILTLD